jgi:hypothetical protein
MILTMIKHSFLLATLCVWSLAGCSKKSDDAASSGSAAKPAPAAAGSAAPSAAAPAAPAAPAGGGGGTSCMNKSASTCTDYLGDASAAESCGAMGGTFSASPCTTAKKLGTCTLDAMRKRLTYYPGGEDNLTAQLAQDDCKGMSGTWAP